MIKSRTNLTDKQKGATTAGWLIIASIILFFIYLAIRLFPAYLEFFNIKGAMETLKEQKAELNSNKKIKYLLQRRFDFNQIKVVEAKTAVIKENDGKKTIYLEYNKKIPMFGNASVLLEFEHEEPLQ